MGCPLYMIRRLPNHPIFPSPCHSILAILPNKEKVFSIIEGSSSLGDSFPPYMRTLCLRLIVLFLILFVYSFLWLLVFYHFRIIDILAIQLLDIESLWNVII